MEKLTRRDLLKGVVASFAVASLSPLISEVSAEDIDPIKNTELNTGLLPSLDYIHPMSQGQVWPYCNQIRQPGIPNAGVFSKTVGQLELTGPTDVGFDIKTDSTLRYRNDQKGSGARSALWVHAEKGDLVYLMDQNDQPLRSVAVDDNGFAGILYPDDLSTNYRFGLRVVRAPGTAGIVTVDFGNISQADYADPKKRNNPNVIDSNGVLSPDSQLTIPTPVAAVTPDQSGLPDFLPQDTVSTFQDAPVNTFFLARSNKGEGWSHFVQFNKPENNTGVFYRDNGNVGEVFIQTRNPSRNHADLIVRTNPLFANDYKNGDSQNHPGMWYKTQPGASLQLIDTTGTVNSSSTVDGAGYGGVVLPDQTPATLRVRLLLPHPEIDTDTQIQFGAADTAARAKSSTLDLSGR